MADALADAGVDVAAWVPESRLDVSPCERSHALAVVLEDGLYYITGGQRLGSPTGFAAVAAALPALAASSASTTAELREAVRVSARPGLVAVRIDEQLKPEPSPFVDPALVRVRFAERLERLG